MNEGHNHFKWNEKKEEEQFGFIWIEYSFFFSLHSNANKWYQRNLDCFHTIKGFPLMADALNSLKHRPNIES